MVQYRVQPADRLSATFAALADPTRRAILARLAAGEASVTELAEPFAMSLPAISKHLKVLERAGLIARGREAQWRPCRLEAGAAQGGRRLARALPPVLGRELRPARRLPARVAPGRGRAGCWRRVNTGGAPPTERVLVIDRVFDAPRERVWKAWADPAQAKRWMGPHGFTATHLEGELRPGGAWRACLRRDADGEELWQGGVYREVVEPERLVFTFAWDGGRAGGPGRKPW